MTEVEKLRASFALSNYKLKPEFQDILVDKHRSIAEKQYGDDIFGYVGPFSFLDGIPSLTACCRIVLGAHGPYVEFEEEHALFEMTIPSYQEWRITSNKAKYYYLEPVGRREKIYLQKETVSYADYLIDKFYIDLYALKIG